MTEQYRFDFVFRRDQVVDVDAAVVGIGRARWVSLTEDEAADLERARLAMAEHRFDVMPVEVPGEEVTGYVRTLRWNDFSEVERRDITPADLMHQRTPLDEVIRSFATSNRSYYFLTSYGRVTGLISLVNFNCRQAQIFLYGLVNELETAIARLLQRELDRGALTLDFLRENVGEQARGLYQKDRDQGVDAELVEYMSLSDLVTVLTRHMEHRQEENATGWSWPASLERLRDLRNRVAHPVRSLVSKPDDVERLWEDVFLIETALSRLASAA